MMDVILFPYIPELKIKDYTLYKCYLRGVRRQIYEDYGLLSCLALSGKTVTFAIMADGLAGRQATYKKMRARGHLLKKEAVMCQTQGIRLAAQLEMILMWHQVHEVSEERDEFRTKMQVLFFDLFLKDAYKRAIKSQAAFERFLYQQREQVIALRDVRERSYDVAAEPYCNVYSAVFALLSANDMNCQNLMREIGRDLGKIKFLSSTAVDCELDKKRESYNVFVENGLNQETAIESAKRQCYIAANDLARAYNLLNVQLNQSLLWNIMVRSLQNNLERMGENVRPERF